MVERIPTPAQEEKVYSLEVAKIWHKVRTSRPGLERFTDARAIHNLKIAAGRAWGRGLSLGEVEAALWRKGIDPKANPWYLDEWAAEERSRKDYSHFAGSEVPPTDEQLRRLKASR